MADDDLKSYLADVASAPVLSVAEEKALAERASAGDEEAATALVHSSLRLVVALARRYAATGVPLLDLIQEGNLGLMKAVERFDPTRGFAFRSYATWWIRQSIALAVRASEAEGALGRIQEVWDAFVAHAGRQPTLAELAAETGFTEQVVSELLGPPPDFS